MKGRFVIVLCVLLMLCFISGNEMSSNDTDRSGAKRGLVDTVADHERFLPPVGAIVPYIGKWNSEDERKEWEQKSGWAVCDGRSITSLKWWTAENGASKALKEILTDKNDGCLPNLCEKVPVGKSKKNGPLDQLCKTGGESSATLTGANIPQHSHQVYRHAAEIAKKENNTVLEQPYWNITKTTTGAHGGDTQTEVYDNWLTGTGVYKDEQGRAQPLPAKPHSVPTRDPYFVTYYIIRLR